MSESGNNELTLDSSFDHAQPVYMPRRIRHISSVQVRNLTPFPVRDALASALSQPAEQSQFNSHGHLTDDLDISMTMKRSRRISVNSVSTMRSIKSDEGDAIGTGTGDPASTARGRTRALSRASTSHSVSSRAGNAPTVRGPRNRTTSNASSTKLASSSLALPAFYQDHSQTGLEKVIKTRLVETFLSITVHSAEPPAFSDDSGPSSPLSGKFSPRSPSTPSPTTRKPAASKEKKLNGADTTIKGHRATASNVDRIRLQEPPSPRPGFSKNSSLTHSKSASVSTPRTQTKSPKTFPNACAVPSTPQSVSSVPDFLSSIHPPSTNPSFPIDCSTDFASGTDLTADDLTITVWAKDTPSSSPAGKGKERSPPPDVQSWKLLDEWKFNLSDLVPMSEELHTQLSHLPSNTIVLRLDPPGHLFYLPPPRILRSRSPSPSGYASDPEAHHNGHVQDIFTNSDSAEILSTSRRRHRWSGRHKSHSPEGCAQTANWQDLFNLVTLQSCIQDTQASLDGVIRRIDQSILDDTSTQLTCQVNERQTRTDDLRFDLQKVRTLCSEREADIATRRAQLKQRRETLRLARGHLRESASQLSALEQSEVEERARLGSLTSRIAATRTTVLSTLATIYPIELRSPPDLLYTIVDVPLPIPLASTDPAPPLALPAHKDINEDTVATALGYAAHLVQFIAAYLGRSLVYPITYVGSRSLIRDGISAMVGPRMFPLFSKGVDTYRFEYGVFLLNKDIELLMAEQDLRALDMRHTLPNLKNLLLTITNGESVPVARPSRSFIALTSAGGLESPRPSTPVETGETDSPTTPKPSDADAQFEFEASGSGTGTSGSRTPTVETIKKSRNGFMNVSLNPLAGLGFLSLRRYPVASVGGKADDGDGVDEDDRRTIRGDDGDGEALLEEREKAPGVGARAPTVRSAAG